MKVGSPDCWLNVLSVEKIIQNLRNLSLTEFSILKRTLAKNVVLTTKNQTIPLTSNLKVNEKRLARSLYPFLHYIFQDFCRFIIIFFEVD